MLVYFALGDTKVWHWGSKPTPGPNANGFASQWNIGLRGHFCQSMGPFSLSHVSGEDTQVELSGLILFLMG